MRKLRVGARILALAAWTTACYLCLVASLLLKGRAGAWQLRWRNALFGLWARGFARIVGMRMAIAGMPPRGPFLLVTNHVSYMDIILLATQLHAAFVAKADLHAWPVLGRVFATADTIFIDRRRRRDVLRVMDSVARELDRGLGVVIFPEGTSSKGENILPFKPPLLDFAARRDFPVHYAALSYATPEGQRPAHEAVCWWGDAAFRPHFFQLLELPRFDARLAFGPSPVHDPDRKFLARKLRAAIAELFTPSE